MPQPIRVTTTLNRTELRHQIDTRFLSPAHAAALLTLETELNHLSEQHSEEIASELKRIASHYAKHNLDTLDAMIEIFNELLIIKTLRLLEE